MRRMARLAQERRTHLQQAFGAGSMRVMACRAIFTDRLVCIHKRAAFLHMAGVADVIYAIALHEFRTDRAMRIVAIGACHFALWNRVMRKPVDLCALILVAGKADFRLGSPVTHFVAWGVNVMALSACYILALVDTSLPVRTVCILLVACEALTTLLFCAIRCEVA